MTPTTSANEVTRKSFVDGAKRTRAFQKKMLLIAGGASVVILAVTVVLFMLMGEAAIMVPVFAAAIGIKLYRMMLYDQMSRDKR